jgi:hypothetical protein
MTTLWRVQAVSTGFLSEAGAFHSHSPGPPVRAQPP